MTGPRHLDAVFDCAARGLSRREIAAELGIHVVTIASYVKQFGVAPVPGRCDHREAIAELAAQGMHARAIAVQLGISRSTVDAYSRRHGLVIARKKCVPADNAASRKAAARAATMATMYRDGYTLEQVGRQFGVTRERIRQIITKLHGLTARDGGECVRAQKKAAVRKREADAYSLRRYGCSRDEWRELRRAGQVMMEAGATVHRTPLRAFISQKGNARTRGIAWEMSLWEWWQVWCRSGKWEQRGLGEGYVMCRFKDEGPYSVSNVFIATSAENVSTRQNKKSGLPIGVSQKKGYFAANRMVAGNKLYLGTYKTPELAHAAYLACNPASNPSRSQKCEAPSMEARTA